MGDDVCSGLMGLGNVRDWTGQDWAKLSDLD